MFDQEPQDIFAGTDKPPAQTPPNNVVRASVAPAPRPQPAMAPQPVAAPVMMAPRQEPAPHTHFARNMIIVVAAIVAIGVGAYSAYAFMIKPIMDASVVPVLTTTPPAKTTATTPTTPETPAVVPDTNTNTAGTIPTLTPTNLNPTFLDSDGDGLNNADELAAGTSSTNPDTDGDGLGDREEVKVYGTDPLRTDTDGDGFLDGAEVKAGYNPNGPGKLMQIPTTP